MGILKCPDVVIEDNEDEEEEEEDGEVTERGKGSGEWVEINRLEI
jgi:hypothetical protein